MAVLLDIYIRITYNNLCQQFILKCTRLNKILGVFDPR